MSPMVREQEMSPMVREQEMSSMVREQEGLPMVREREVAETEILKERLRGGEVSLPLHLPPSLTITAKSSKELLSAPVSPPSTPTSGTGVQADKNWQTSGLGCNCFSQRFDSVLTEFISGCLPQYKPNKPTAAAWRSPPGLLVKLPCLVLLTLSPSQCDGSKLCLN